MNRCKEIVTRNGMFLFPVFTCREVLQEDTAKSDPDQQRMIADREPKERLSGRLDDWTTYARKAYPVGLP
jgi:hypothetical protein